MTPCEIHTVKFRMSIPAACLRYASLMRPEPHTPLPCTDQLRSAMMYSEPRPTVGVWYTGQGGSGLFQVIDHDSRRGLLHLRGLDGRRVRMTVDSWSKEPLEPATHAIQAALTFEWDEPVVG
jgi:hypothetical protein